MSSFEEFLYTQHLEEEAEKEKEQIDRQVYELLNKKRDIDKDVKGVIEYRKSLINEILIINENYIGDK